MKPKKKEGKTRPGPTCCEEILDGEEGRGQHQGEEEDEGPRQVGRESCKVSRSRCQVVQLKESFKGFLGELVLRTR